jgi:dihydrolipoamide dehydrogenase
MLTKTKQQAVDVLVIGGGPGGTPAALALAQCGKRVMLVEQGDGLGGTCLFEGCIPSKIFRETASRLRAIQRAGDFGIDLHSAAPSVVWAEVMERKRAILSKRSQAALRNAQNLPLLQIVHGHASLLGPRSAKVVGSGAQVMDVGFEQVILATGSQSVRPAFVGADLPGVWLTDQLLSLDHIPVSLILIGGGPIGVEMAQIFHLLGSHVTLLQGRPQILPGMEPDLAQRLQQTLQDDGIDLRCGVRAQAIAQMPGGLAVHFADAQGRVDQVVAEHIGLAVGRRPQAIGLGLDNTKVQLGSQGMQVDAQLQTQEPGIYAVGDLVGQPMFAHWATAQGLALAQHLLGQSAPFPRPEHNTAVIFSHPEFATAGLTSEQAKAANLNVDMATYDYGIDARAQIGAEKGLLRLIFERTNHRIVGVHALIEGASDLIGEAALAVRIGVTLEQMAQSIHPHPTLTESMGLLARQTLSRLLGQAAHAHHPVP